MKVSRASRTTGPIGVVIDVHRGTSAEDEVVVALSGDIDMFSLPRLRAALDEWIGRRDVVLDLREVGFCDSSSLRLLVDAQRRSAAAGRSLEVRCPSRPVRNLFEVSGLRGVLHVTV